MQTLVLNSFADLKFHLSNKKISVIKDEDLHYRILALNAQRQLDLRINYLNPLTTFNSVKSVLSFSQAS